MSDVEKATGDTRWPIRGVVIFHCKVRERPSLTEAFPPAKGWGISFSSNGGSCGIQAKTAPPPLPRF